MINMSKFSLFYQGFFYYECVSNSKIYLVCILISVIEILPNKWFLDT